MADDLPIGAKRDHDAHPNPRYPFAYLCAEQSCCWAETYYGWECENCGAFVPSGCEPWAPDDFDADTQEGE